MRRFLPDMSAARTPGSSPISSWSVSRTLAFAEQLMERNARLCGLSKIYGVMPDLLDFPKVRHSLAPILS